MGNVIKGKIHKIGHTEQITEKLTKRLLVVDTGAKFSSMVPIDFINGKTDALDMLSEGADIEVTVTIGGREHNGKYYPSISGDSIAGLGEIKASEQKTSTAKQAEPISGVDDDSDGLPF